MLSPSLRQQLASLEGLVSEGVGLKLSQLSAVVPPRLAVVEIGSYKGKSTCYLAAGAQYGKGAFVHAVDPWDTPGNVGGRFHFDTQEVRQAFRRQVDSMLLTSRVIVHQGFSVEVARSWDIPIGLLYIDGSHTEKDVRADWVAWSRFLAPGAVVAFDDYDTPRNPGVKRVVDQIHQDLPDIRWEFGPAPLMVGVLP